MSAFYDWLPDIVPTLLDNHLSLQDAVDHSGYNLPYLRRLLRVGVLRAVKIGQMWLVDIRSLNAYLRSICHTDDCRYGPRVFHLYNNQQK